MAGRKKRRPLTDAEVGAEQAAQEELPAGSTGTIDKTGKFVLDKPGRSVFDTGKSTDKGEN